MYVVVDKKRNDEWLMSESDESRDDWIFVFDDWETAEICAIDLMEEGIEVEIETSDGPVYAFDSYMRLWYETFT